MQTIYSIGYAGLPMDHFLTALQDHGISVVLDVRSTPYSRRFPAYNREALADTLRKHSNLYRHYPQSFGARQDDPSLYHPAGYLDFAHFAASIPFQEGIQKVCSGMDLGYVFCVLCAERDPLTCHRTILVTRAFSQLGYNVVHILPYREVQTQADIERRLLDKYFPGRGQTSLFGGKSDAADLLDEAYRRQNAAIGYRRGEAK